MEFDLSAIAYNATRLRARDSKWLAVAIGLHVLILAIPVSRLAVEQVRDGAEIVVRLVGAQSVSQAELVSPQPASQASETPREIAPPIESTAPRRAQTPPVPAITEPTDISPEPQINFSRLVDSRDKLFRYVPDAGKPADDAATLGKFRDSELPPNWRKGAGAEALAPFENDFNDAVAPVDIEVVDRWLASDGSHNVIIETPSGLRLCGRALSWDPMQPLVEHVMRFHICGGDQRTNFKFKPREKFSHYYVPEVAKDASDP